MQGRFCRWVTLWGNPDTERGTRGCSQARSLMDGHTWSEACRRARPTTRAATEHRIWTGAALLHVSIHAAHAGSDVAVRFQTRGPAVSIHAAHAGSDTCGQAAENTSPYTIPPRTLFQGILQSLNKNRSTPLSHETIITWDRARTFQGFDGRFPYARSDQ
jgi:hypothetical protein